MKERLITFCISVCRIHKEKEKEKERVWRERERERKVCRKTNIEREMRERRRESECE